MERFFIVKNEDLIELLKEYESMRRKVDEAFKAFKKEVGIETVKYYQSTDVLKIVPTENDLDKFSSMMKVDRMTFRQNSAINKAWVKICMEKGLKTPRKPNWELSDLINDNIYKFRSRLFSLNDKVYGSFECDFNFYLPDEHFIELKASEFYRIIEEENSKETEGESND